MTRRLVPLLVVLPAILLRPADAQERSQPRLILSLFGGVTTGSALWTVDRQPVFINSTTTDTVRLVRRLQPGIMFGASGTLFPSPHFGIYGEIAFLGLGLENRCQVVYLDPVGPGVPASPTTSVCSDITTSDGGATTGAFLVGVVARASPQGFASPFFRLTTGITTRASSTTEVVGRFVNPTTNSVTLLPIINDPGGGTVAPTLIGALGVMIALAPGYQLHLELRDHLLMIDRVTGAADPVTLLATTEKRMEQNFALSVGLDIVLERRRGRRY